MFAEMHTGILSVQEDTYTFFLESLTPFKSVNPG